MDDVVGVVIGFGVLMALVIIYFIPFIIANQRKHRNQAGIFLLTLFAAWTVIGWIAALIWAFSDNTNEVSSKRADRKCPFCAEVIKKEAVKCRHCGSDLVQKEIPTLV